MELWKTLAQRDMQGKLYEVVEQTLHQFASVSAIFFVIKFPQFMRDYVHELFPFFYFLTRKDLEGDYKLQVQDISNQPWCLEMLQVWSSAGRLVF